MTATTTYYTASGSVRGDCGHKHETAGDAWKCCHRDQTQCGNLGGGAYSDRGVVRADGEPLTEADIRSMDKAQERVYGY